MDKPTTEKHHDSPSTSKKFTRIRWKDQDQATNKKPHPHHKKRNFPLDVSYLTFLNAKKNQQIDDEEYSQAEKKDKIIKNLRKNIKEDRIRSLSEQHIREKQSIRVAHHRQMKSFRRAWEEIFTRNRIYQQRKLHELDCIRERQIQYTEQEVLRRCRSAKPSLKIKEIKDLQRQETFMKKYGNFSELKRIKSEKKKKKNQYKLERQAIHKRIVEQEEKKMAERQTKRYNSFMARIKSTKQDSLAHYKRQEFRLKQKYKNILHNLEHDQKLQMNSVLHD